MNETLEDLSHALKLDDKDPITFRLLGQAHLRAGNRPPALEYYAKALALLKTDPVLWYERGSIYQGADDHASAVADYERALAIKPDYWDALYNHAVSLIQLGRREAAVDDLRRLSAADVDPVLQAFAAARLKELGITDKPRVVSASLSVKQRLFIHYIDPDDRDLVGELARGLDQALGGVQSVQLVNRPTAGDVRYFFRDDREYALRVKASAEEKIESMTGKRVELAVLGFDDGRLQARPGNVELWLAPLKGGAK